MELYISNLIKAKEIANRTENIIALAQLSKNKRLFLLSLEEMEKIIKKIISSILHYEYKLKRISLKNNSEKNFELFEQKSYKNYISSQELKMMKEILKLAKLHKESSMEFMKNGNIIIMDKNQNIKKMPLQKATHFLYEIQKIMQRLDLKIKR